MSGARVPKNVAIHESAHGVVARALGCRRIVLTVQGGLSGDCSYEMPSGPTGLEEIRRQLTIHVAGHAAEFIAAGRDPLGGSAGAGQTCQNILIREGLPRPHARAWALGELEEEFGDRLSAFRWLDAAAAGILRNAVEILRRNWPEIERVAVQLETQKEVSL